MKPSSGLSAPPRAVDPALGALFAASTGPLAPPPKSRYSELVLAKDDQDESCSFGDEAEHGPAESDDSQPDSPSSDDDHDGDSGGSAKADKLLSDAAEAPTDTGEDVEATPVLEAVVGIGRRVGDKSDRKRKRKQRDEHDDLESKYLDRLADDDEADGAAPSGKRRKGEESEPVSAHEDGKEGDDDDAVDVPMHESLATDKAAAEVEKAGRTVFLSNVSSAAITSCKAKRALLAHLASVLDKAAKPPQTIESVRFRSTAFSTASIPKRAAFIKREVMDATTRSTNAYAVYSTAAAARLAVARLNGTVVLDRHLRVDSVAHPAPTAHRRCVFVGNLGFVDDETVLSTKIDAETGKEVTEKRKRTKVAMDVEEGLWRIFGEHGGKVESVRVVRDPVTRIGKGFAYVQFDDTNAVEAALLLEGKKFPPMLPRALRVSRCKAPHKTTRALEAKKNKATTTTPATGPSSDQGRKRNDSRRPGGANGYVPKPTAESQTLAGRAGRLLGRAGAAQIGKTDRQDNGGRRGVSSGHDNRETATTTTSAATAGKTPQQDMVFEGRRASAKDGKPKDLKFKGSGGGGGGGGKHGAKRHKNKNKSAMTGRGAVRAAKWKAQGAA